jgi:hypothetical protein
MQDDKVKGFRDIIAHHSSDIEPSRFLKLDISSLFTELFKKRWGQIWANCKKDSVVRRKSY